MFWVYEKIFSVKSFGILYNFYIENGYYKISIWKVLTSKNKIKSLNNEISSTSK